ncbi:MAG TPA: bifunctional 2-C-methyl-D-erythritol 4-phosphate cytidylyltransferase/2-C-methyl-D-erythritol 2,4-cyclodiphosphate synthase [Deltaproteobacteria bacterium]|nr:bifunctional 2-C-methyl-D-erythritol 4-phosphate cytidylyltransferase/2-C-methyl-D-erythritol 2,4-cyclodiphosphate synthase [Deltaproteobacteria bacterium]
MSQAVWAILVAGGMGTRFGSKLPKQFLPLAGRRVIDYSLEVCARSGLFGGAVLVVPQDFVAECRTNFEDSGFVQFRVTAGGLTRQHSVQKGLAQVDSSAEWIVIHDVARPLVSEEIFRRTLAGARETGTAVAAVALADTLKQADERFEVQRTIPRDHLFQVQTPQAFSRKILQEALAWASAKGHEATDEAGLVESLGHRVKLVEGSVFNFKITRAEDLAVAEALVAKRRGEAVSSEFRIGEGYDVHPFVAGRDLVLGGVKIPFEQGLQGHSDADALLHAVGDALLGAVAEGDLGKHFPDTDPRFKGVSSRILLEEVARLVAKKGFAVSNVDATLVCQRPKLAPYIPEMRENIAASLRIAADQVSVKATTEEGLGFTGRMEGLAAKAVVLLKTI